MQRLVCTFPGQSHNVRAIVNQFALVNASLWAPIWGYCCLVQLGLLCFDLIPAGVIAGIEPKQWAGCPLVKLLDDEKGKASFLLAFGGQGRCRVARIK